MRRIIPYAVLPLVVLALLLRPDEVQQPEGKATTLAETPAAWVVCIAEGTLGPDCSVGDVVAIHEGHIDLSSTAYQTFRLIRVEGISGADLRILLENRRPQVRTDATGRPIEWLDGATWKIIADEPHYPYTCGDLTQADADKLASGTLTPVERTAILAKVTETIHRDPDNHVEVME